MEKQYEKFKEFFKNRDCQKMGLMSSWAWHDDPKRMTFMMSRYKFVSKILSGYEDILEVGCGDAFGSRIVANSCQNLTCVDFDTDLLESAQQTFCFDRVSVKFALHNMLEGPIKGDFDAAFCLDVLEHIPQDEESKFINNVVQSMSQSCAFLVGMPSLESQKYASELSVLGHINCKTQKELFDTMRSHFRHVFIFSMNDEVVHTGFASMSNYNIALGVN